MKIFGILVLAVIFLIGAVGALPVPGGLPVPAPGGLPIPAPGGLPVPVPKGLPVPVPGAG